MDPLQAPALAALEPFLALCPSATSPRAAADLISRAVAAQGTFVFAELLGAPNIQALAQSGVDAQHARWLAALQIFSWGTWADYEANSALPQLSPPQSHKLRLLTLLSLAHTPNTDLTYAHLQKALSLPDKRALESLVTDAIYSGLITARLDPDAGIVRVASVAPLRDLAPGRVKELEGLLSAWEERCAEVLTEVEGRAADIKARAVARGKTNGEWEDLMEKKLEAVNEEKEGVKRKVEAEGGSVKKGGRFGRRGA